MPRHQPCSSYTDASACAHPWHPRKHLRQWCAVFKMLAQLLPLLPAVTLGLDFPSLEGFLGQPGSLSSIWVTWLSWASLPCKQEKAMPGPGLLGSRHGISLPHPPCRTHHWAHGSSTQKFDQAHRNPQGSAPGSVDRLKGVLSLKLSHFSL